MAIVYNSTARFNEDSSSSSTTTWSHTCNALDTKLIVVVGGRASISSVTYNGVSMTLISSQFDTYQYNAVYYLDNPDTSAAHNVVATYSGANQYRTGLSVGLSGANSGIGATGTSPTDFNVTTPKTVTSSITTTVNDSHIFTVPSANDGGTDTYITYGASQTEIYRNNAGNWAFRIQYKTKATAGSDTTSISNNTSVNNIAIMSFELKLAPTNIDTVAGNGSFTLTGQDATATVGYHSTAENGSFTLTGFDATAVIRGGWSNTSKSATATMTNTSKSSSTWTNRGKNQ